MSEKFEYKYTAPTIEEQREIESIRNQYIKKEIPSSKIERLRELNNKVQRFPAILGLSLGIVGTLVFGTGMTFFLEWRHLWYIGVPLAVLGMVLISVAMPVYKKVKDLLMTKYRNEILELSESLLNERK